MRNRIAKVIKLLRKHWLLTQKDLSEKCNVEQCQISAIETGKTVTTKTLEQVITYFGKPVYHENKGVTLSGFFSLCEQIDLVEEELSFGLTDKELKNSLGYVGSASSIGDFAVNMGYVWFPGNRKWISKENISDTLDILPRF